MSRRINAPLTPDLLQGKFNFMCKVQVKMMNLSQVVYTIFKKLLYS